MLGKLSVPGRPTNLDNIVGQGPTALGWEMFGHFFSRLSFLFPSLGGGPI